MKVFVAGGAGYIGSVLCRQLYDSGHEVTAFDRLMFGAQSLEDLLDEPRFRLIEGDIRDESALGKAIPGHDAVVVLAAIVGEPACNRDPDAARETNFGGAMNLLNVSKATDVERFVFASTCSNYGVSAPDALVDENAELNPISVYAESKVNAENEILAAASDSFCPSVLRFATAFGVSPRMRFDLLVSDFTLAAVRDGRLSIYGQQFWRPFVHIADISRAVEQVLSAQHEDVSGEVFNVGSNEENYRKIDLGEAVRTEVKGTELKFVEKNEDPRSYRVNFDKIRERLGFRAEWSVPDGIREVHSALLAGHWSDTTDKRFYN